MQINLWILIHLIWLSKGGTMQLDSYVCIWSVTCDTTKSFHLSLMVHKKFRSGRVNSWWCTSWLQLRKRFQFEKKTEAGFAASTSRDLWMCLIIPGRVLLHHLIKIKTGIVVMRPTAAAISPLHHHVIATVVEETMCKEILQLFILLPPTSLLTIQLSPPRGGTIVSLNTDNTHKYTIKIVY